MKESKTHRFAFKNNSNSKFSQHFLEYGHSFGKMENITQILPLTKKKTYLCGHNWKIIQLKRNHQR